MEENWFRVPRKGRTQIKKIFILQLTNFQIWKTLKDSVQYCKPALDLICSRIHKTNFELRDKLKIGNTSAFRSSAYVKALTLRKDKCKNSKNKIMLISFVDLSRVVIGFGRGGWAPGLGHFLFRICQFE